MVSGRYKSRTFRRVFKKTPGGRTVLRYARRKPGKAHCGDCGAVLLSIPRARAVEMHKIPPSSRRPQRPFPGLCPSCSRQRIIKLVKQNV